MPSCAGVAFRYLEDVGPRDQTYFGAQSHGLILPVYASQSGYPAATQHSVPAVGTLGRAGLVTRWVPMKSFRDLFNLFPISQALPGALKG